MASATYTQSAFRIGVNNPTGDDPDSIQTWANIDQDVSKFVEEKFHIRIQVINPSNTNGDSVNWQLYYNTTDNSATAVAVNTTSSGNAAYIVDDGTITDQSSVTDNLCGAQDEAWANGLYVDASNQTNAYTIAKTDYTEFQFCVALTSLASGSYFFYMRQGGTALNVYTANQTPEITAAGSSSSSVSSSSFSSSSQSSSSSSSSSVSSSSFSSSSQSSSSSSSSSVSSSSFSSSSQSSSSSSVSSSSSSVSSSSQSSSSSSQSSSSSSTFVGSSSSSSAVPQDVTIITQYETGWKYLQPDADNTALYTDYNANPSGYNFTQPDYDDSSWLVGQAGIGYLITDFGVNTLCNDPGSGSRDQALYLRKHFFVNNVDTIIDWTFQVNIDDGAVIWLNGTEIGRYGVAAGTVTDSTLATHTAGASTDPLETQWHTIDFSTPTGPPPGDPNWDPTVSDPWTYLVEGENVLVLAVHQITNASSDQKGDVSFYVTGYATLGSSSSSTLFSSSSSISSSSSKSSSSSSRSSSSSSISSSSSMSSSSAWAYETPGGIAWGEENPTEEETPISWLDWSDGEGGTPGVTDWGSMCLYSGEEAWSTITHFGDGNPQTITVTLGKYGAVPGSFNVYIRGQASVFAQDDGSPSWELYTGIVVKSWEYIQVRLVGI